jgi:phosphatidylserine/phosphatidylglycerophosphate/cardiolipin synthase-like enzyme
MTSDHYRLGVGACHLARHLPYTVLVAVANALRQCDGMERSAARLAVLQSLPTPNFRDATSAFLDLWESCTSEVGSGAVTLALFTAAEGELPDRRRGVVEVAWTGPELADTHFRQTEQAILEVINSATERLTVVSYAVYRIPRIREALVAAAGRGVLIRLIVETPNRIEGQGEYDCLLALGSDVASACTVYYWPQEKRSKDEKGKFGILHVKCAVADGHRTFLSSANFTEYAFTINMELGLLVTGGNVPGQIERHFDRLVDEGIVARVV